MTCLTCDRDPCPCPSQCAHQAERVEQARRLGQVADAAAEDGEPDVLELAQAALDGDEDAARYTLAFWRNWNAAGRFWPVPAKEQA